MLTISQLAGHVGVTVRAVRHYHRIGLLAEPERDASGYRRYDAAAVVRLIRINTLAQAGVPLARVQELLDADPDRFTDEVDRIDRKLAAEIDRLQEARSRIARLAAGDLLALPATVVAYLDRIRGLGVDERYVAMERDAWIMVCAQMPHLIDEVIAAKHRELDDPEMVRFYLLIGALVDAGPDDPMVAEVADILDVMLTAALRAGEPLAVKDMDDQLVALLDSLSLAEPVGRRIISILAERGWTGWTRIERAADVPGSASGPSHD